MGQSHSRAPPVNPVATNWCCTELSETKFSYLWSINKWSSRQEELGQELQSSVFSAPNDTRLWSLKIYPGGQVEQTKKHISVYLCLVEGQGELRATTRLSIINNRRKESNVKTNERAQVFVQGHGWGFPEFIPRRCLQDNRARLLPNDTLTLLCEVSLLGETTNVSGRSLSELRAPECQLSGDLARLLETNDLADCTLSVGGREFRAHKALLSARSPVFAAMFKSKMKEAESNRILVKDIEPETMKHLLQFIYTGNAGLQSCNLQVLAAADKYQLDRLKALCEQCLCESLSVENVCERLIVAHVHSAQQLKAHAVQFINVHSASVSQSEGYKTVVKDHPQLMVDTFKAKRNAIV